MALSISSLIVELGTYIIPSFTSNALHVQVVAPLGQCSCIDGLYLFLNLSVSMQFSFGYSFLLQHQRNTWNWGLTSCF